MPANKKLLILPGDGIGPEVMREVRRVIDWMDRRRMVSFDIAEDLVGGASIDARGTPIADETMQKAKDADADPVRLGRRPEMGHARLRAAPGTRRSCGCARNSTCSPTCGRRSVLDPLVDASTLKPDVVRGLDLMIVRESTGGIYFGEPRGIETLPDGEQRGFDTESYTTSEIERVARVAFELARKRRNQRHQRGEGQRDAVRPVLAPDRHRAARARTIADVRARAHVRRQLRHAAGAQSAAVRRDRDVATSSATCCPTWRRC